MTHIQQARRLRDALRGLVVAHGVLNATRRPCGAPLPVPHAYTLLELLQAPGGLTSTLLAERLSIDRTNVSRLLGRMEKLGEIRRRADRADSRAKLITLTARGKRIAQGLDKNSATYFAELAKELAFPPEQISEVLESLRGSILSRGATLGGVER